MPRSSRIVLPDCPHHMIKNKSVPFFFLFYGLDGSWAQCYTNCISTLAPGFTDFFVGSQIVSNAPYTLVIRPTAQGNLLVREIPNAISILLPKAWKVIATISRTIRPVQAVTFSWVAGASYGCMISCTLNTCNY